MDPGRADEAVTTEGAPHRHRAGRTRRWVELVAGQLHPATCPVCVTPSLALNSNLEQIAYMPGVVEAPIAPRETTAGRRGRMALEPPAHGDGEGGIRLPRKRNVWKSTEKDARRPPGNGSGMGDGGGASQPEGTGGARDATSRGRGLLACARLWPVGSCPGSYHCERRATSGRHERGRKLAAGGRVQAPFCVAHMCNKQSI